MAEKYYEAYDDRYKQIHSMHLEWEADVHSPILDEIMDKYGLTLKSKILELGCGEGRDAIYLMKHGYDICASDISPEAVLFCKRKAPKHAKRFVVLNACEDTLDETYDFIYSIAVLHMLVLEEDRNKFLTFIREHLNESGFGLILSMGDGEMDRSSGIDGAFEKQERVHMKTGLKVCVASTSCKIVSFPVLERELEQNGLLIIEKGITSIEPGFPVIMYAVVKRGKGNGTEIFRECCVGLKEEGYRYIRLGFAKGNPQSEAFWTKNGFERTGVEDVQECYTVVVLQKKLA